MSANREDRDTLNRLNGSYIPERPSEQPEESQTDDTGEGEEVVEGELSDARRNRRTRKQSLPQLPTPSWDMSSFSLETILQEARERSGTASTATVDKRASRVLKLQEENDKLAAELAALNARLAAVEKKKSSS